VDHILPVSFLAQFSWDIPLKLYSIGSRLDRWSHSSFLDRGVNMHVLSSRKVKSCMMNCWACLLCISGAIMAFDAASHVLTSADNFSESKTDNDEEQLTSDTFLFVSAITQVSLSLLGSVLFSKFSSALVDGNLDSKSVPSERLPPPSDQSMVSLFSWMGDSVIQDLQFSSSIPILPSLVPALFGAVYSIYLLKSSRKQRIRGVN
jgi:hypothetical protein